MYVTETIVLGVGGIGSAALYHLARRGTDVIGLEQFDVPNDMGSSHGETRLIRLAYFENPLYVPLLKTSYRLWRELQTSTSDRIFDDGVGLLTLGRRGTQVVLATLAAARQYGLTLESLARDEVAQRFPQLPMPCDFDALWDPAGGVLRVERCVTAHVEAAMRHGARIFTQRHVLRWRVDGAQVEVETETECFRARRLVITAGAWTDSALRDLGLPLEIRRKVLFWFQPSTDAFALGRFPAFVYDIEGALDDGPSALRDVFIYGFPDTGNGVKIANHRDGQALREPTPRRGLLAGDTDAVVAAVRRFFPDLNPEPTRHKVCMYTMTPDEDFIVDRHPLYGNVWFAAGFSGHGFKFAPVMGSVLADLALEGRTEEPIDFLRLGRF